MDNTFVEKSSQRQVSKSVLILSIVALAFNVMYFISSFFSYAVYGISPMFGDYSYRLIFSFPGIFTFIALLALLSASLLLLIYFLKFYTSGKNKVLFTVALGLLALYILLSSPLFTSFSTGNVMLLIDLISTLLYFGISAVFILAAIFWQSGKINKKVFIITLIVVISLYALICLVTIFSSVYLFIEHKIYIYIIKLFFSVIGMSCLFLAPFIFWLKNAIPDWKNEKIASSMPSPEEELFALNEKLELGIITEEEYQLLREEIIQRL